MANWWETAPLVEQPSTQPAAPSTSSGGDAWWQSAPLADAPAQPAQPAAPASKLTPMQKVDRLIESKPQSPLADSYETPATRSQLAAPEPRAPAPTSALAQQVSPVDRTAQRMQGVLDEIVVTAPRLPSAPWREVFSELPTQIGARIESRIAGVKEYRGEEIQQQAKKRYWQAQVLPDAVRRAAAAKRAGEDYSLWNDPSVIDAAKHVGIRIDQFVRDWPAFVNKSEEELQQIMREARKHIGRGYELKSEGAQRRRMAQRVAEEGRPEIDEWSAKGLVFDALLSVPDLLAGVGGSMLGGPIAGGAVMAGLVAPDFYAEARNRGADHRKAETYATLMTLAEVAPEVPVLELVARTPAAEAAMKRIVGEAFASSAVGQIAGTAALEGISESVTEALQTAINAGVMDEEVTLGQALSDIARAGIIGVGMGGAVGTVPALMRRRGGKPRTDIDAELAELDEASLTDADLDRQIRELEDELGEGQEPPPGAPTEETATAPAETSAAATEDTDALDLADLTAIDKNDAIAGQIKRAVELGYAKRVAPDRAELTAEGRRRLKELQTGEPVADVEVTLEGEDLRRAGEVPEPRQVDVVPSKENEGWFTILVDGQPHVEVASRKSADQIAADLRTKTETEGPETATKPPESATERDELQTRIASDEGLRTGLEEMARESGWLEVGGKLMRKSDDPSSPDYNVITGRTKWIPRADWWPDRPKGFNEQKTKDAIAKALAGEKLSKPERRLIEFLVQVHDQRTKLDDFVPTADEMPAGEETLDQAFESAMVARAAEIDEATVERLAIRYESDTIGFLKAIWAFLDDYDNKRLLESGAESQRASVEAEAVAKEETAAQARVESQEARQAVGGSRFVPDLFGQDTRAQQALADEIRRRDQKRSPNVDVPLETGDPTDLFSQARQQVDLTDVAPAPPASKSMQFKPGPNSTRYRVGSVAATGGVMFERDHAGGTRGSYYVNVDGRIEETNRFRLNRPEDRKRIWQPPDERTRQAAEAALDELGQAPVGSPEAAAAREKLRRIVKGESSDAGAESSARKEPTPAQKAAGNYPKRHVRAQGLEISIENEVGSVRTFTRPDGTKGERIMKDPYGYFRRTEDNTGEQVDVFLGPNPDAPTVYVIDQVIDGKFDEPKVMFGYNSEEEARQAYLRNYQRGWKGLGAITGLPIDEFKQWLKSTGPRKPLAWEDGKEQFVDASKLKAPKQEPDQDVSYADQELTLEKVQDFDKRLRAGEVSLDEYKATFDALKKNRAALIDELEKLSKEELVNIHKNYRGRNEKKDWNVRAAYDDLVERFALHKTLSFTLVGDYQRALDDAITKIVESVTQEDLDAFAAREKKLREEHEAMLARMDDPQTLADFRMFIRRRPESELTDEQLERYDALVAEESKEKRQAEKARREADRTRVESAGRTVGSKVIESTHTKHGYPIFVVQLDERVDRDVYDKLNKAAKQLGGYYSSYRGRGAIPGFTFKERDKAEAFAQLAQTGDTSAASEVVKERREAFEDDKAQTTVERLRAMAERLEESAQERLNQDRKTNTERRARMAARAEAVAREDLQLARTMRNIAEAIDKGEVEFLDNVRTKAQVDMLLSMLETAKREEIIADSKAKHGEWRYQDQIERAGEAPTRRTVRFVKYPRYSIRRGDLAQLGRALLQVPGAKQLGQSILRSADDVTDKYTAWVKNNLLQVALTKSDGNLALFPSKQAAERARLRSPGHQKMVTVSLGKGKNYVVLSPREAQARGLWEGDESKTFNLAEETALEVIDKVKKHNESANWLNRIHLPWTFEDAKEKRARLKAMGIDNPSLLRQALRELIGLMDEKPKADPIKQKMRELVGRRDIGIDFFPTPKGVAENLVARADIQPGMLVLEPSAGYGAIADEVRALGVEPDVVEMSSTLREILELKGYNIVGTDFMELQKQYDRIVMNPPFSNGMDIDHVRHAYDLLKPGGRIVAIMGQGAFHRSDKKATEFRAWADSIRAIDEELPEGTFLDPSLPVTTGANARVIVIDKPSSGEAPQLSVGLQSTAPFALEKHRTKIEAAVRARLKSVKNAPPVHVLRRITDVPQDVKNRYDIASIEQSRTRYIEGMMDWQRGEVYLFSDALSSQARAGWVLFHELAGHHGIRRAAEQLGINVEKIRDRVLDNPFVKQLADEIGKQRKITDPLRAADEALAEIAAAVRTGDYKHIQDRYGIEVPQAQRKTLRGLIARLVQAIKLALARRFGVRTDEFSDADVYELIERAWKAAQTPPARSATRPQRQPVVLSESPAPVFYSAVLRAAEGIKLEKGTAEQWLGTLRNRPGVKQEELDWIGLEDWLKSLGRSATKQEVVDFIRANQIQVQETLKGAPVARSDTRELLARHDNLVVELTAEGFYPDRYDGTPLVMLESADGRDRWELENREVTNIETGERATARVSRLAMELREIRSQLTEHDLEDDISRDATRYEHLTMAGGQRYRELLLTIPGESRPAMSFEEWADARGIDLSNADDVEALRDSYRRDARHFESGNVFHSSHWNEPNILAHVRFDERVDQEGKRVLFIEEIQSDWHQEGRRKGYRPTDTSGWTARPGTMRPDLYEVFDAEGRSVALSTVTVNQSPYGPTPEQAQRKAIEDVAKRGLPNAPFKTTWPELAFKRMLRWAAENGFDRIAWTTGVQQVARYPAQIRQVVDRITWETERYHDGSSNVVVRGEKGGKRTFKAIVRKDGYVLDGQPREFIGEQLEDVLGKYMASFILRGEESGAIEGQDLTIGGEGMRGFYDDILPKTASKLTKKWGGKVGKTTISAGSSSEVVHSLDITPAMREAALGGLPLFSEAQDPRRARLERLRALRAQRLGITPGGAYVNLFQGGQPMPSMPTAVTIGTGATARTLPIPDRLIRREHIIALLERQFGVKIYQGKPFRGRMLGFFRPSNFEVRIKHKNDLEVTAHEVFHWLDYTYPELRQLYREKRFNQELRSISYDVKKKHEGFAEFGRLFLTQDAEAIKRVPQFYAAFTQKAQQLGIYDKLAKIQDRMHQWYAQGALARARSKVGVEPESLSQRLSTMADAWTNRAAAESVDWLHAAKVIERELTGTIAADAIDSPYKSLRLLAGARNTIESFLNFGTLDWTPKGLDFTGKGLKHVFEPVAHVMDDTLTYFIGRRAQELMKYGKERLFSRDEVEAMLALGENSPYAKEIKQAFDEYQAYVKRLMDFAEHSGIVSAATRRLWEQMYQNYVPFYRVSEAMGATRLTGPSVATPFKRLFGGTANLNDIWDNIVMNTATVVHASMRNMAKRQLFAAIEKSPLGQRYAVRIPTSSESVKVAMTQVEQVLRPMVAEAQARALNPNASAAEKAHYLQVAQALDVLTGTMSSTGGSELANLQEQATFFVGGQPPKIPDKDSVLVNGERVWFQIADPLLWDMLVDINYHKPIGLLETVFGAFKRTLTRGVTVTPEFQIANLFRDTINAFTMSKGGQIPFVDNLRAMYNILRESEDYKLFLANGGGFGNATPVNEGRRVRLRMNKLIGPNRKVNIRAILDTPARLLEAWDKWGQSFELATRVAEFKRIREKGFSLREAAFEGREISGDFAMHGRAGVMRAAMISLPFFNARVQGLYRMERELFERGGRQSWRGDRQVRYAMRGFLGITLPALALYFINKDDEDYQALPEETKDLYYPIKIPDSHDFLLIPKPFETGALFATVPERIWQYYETRNEKKLMDAAQFMIMQTFAFDPVPQVGRPVFEWYANKDWRGMPIVPRGLENVEQSKQYRWNTPESLVRVGRAFDVSPIALDHFLRGYFGGVGSYLTMASDSLVSSGRYGEDPAKRLQDYPVLRRFIREAPLTTTSHERDFWDLKREIDKTVNTERKIRSEYRTDDLEFYLGPAEKQVFFGLKDVTNAIAERAREINTLQISIRRDPTLSGEEKRRQIDALQQELNGLFRQVTRELSNEQLERYRDALEGKMPQASAGDTIGRLNELVRDKPRRQQIAALRGAGFTHTANLVASLPPIPDREALDFFASEMGDLNQ